MQNVPETAQRSEATESEGKKLGGGRLSVGVRLIGKCYAFTTKQALTIAATKEKSAADNKRTISPDLKYKEENCERKKSEFFI